MTNSLQTFSFSVRDVRVVTIDGEPLFVAKDVAELLGYTNPRKATIDHCKHATSLGSNDSLPLDPQTKIIPERDVYRLIMRSRLPEAEKFEDWVVSEVLPAIRKTGSYSVDQQQDNHASRKDRIEIKKEVDHICNIFYRRSDSARHAIYEAIRNELGLGQFADLQ